MSEKTLWQWLKTQTDKRGWHTVRVEDVLNVGTPDVNYAAPSGMEGWVELKYAERFPPSGKPTFSLSHQHNLSPQQELFLTRRAACQSCSGILAQIGKERFFIPASYASEFNSFTEEQFRSTNILEQWLDE